MRLNTAQSQIKIGEYSEAIKNCTKVLEKDNTNLKALYRRGLSHLKSQDFEKAQVTLYFISDWFWDSLKGWSIQRRSSKITPKCQSLLKSIQTKTKESFRQYVFKAIEWWNKEIINPNSFIRKTTRDWTNFTIRTPTRKKRARKEKWLIYDLYFIIFWIFLLPLFIDGDF